MSARDKVAKDAGEKSGIQIMRYIRLTELIPELLDMVDEKKIAFNPAYELSFLKKEEQIQLLDAMDSEQATPSLSQAQRLKKFSQEGRLSIDVMLSLIHILFRDTIRNNIKFGSPDASEEQMIAAAKEARCHDFIMALPDGYDTVIGEGGSSLSGGEKQRISIARAMLKDAPIVILDEATASIDPENEHLIQEAISALTHGKTIITIAHRLATIENADQILVIDGGTVEMCIRDRDTSRSGRRRSASLLPP